MAILSREALLGATAVPTETVQIPELGGSVIVRGMTGKERDAFEAGCWEGRGKHRKFNMQNLRAKLVAACCVDEQGRRIFSDADAVALGEVRGDLMDRLFTPAQRLSGMSQEDLDELGQPSESPTATATSSTASPESST